MTETEAWALLPQIISLVGAALVLAAFAGTSLGRLTPRQALYNVLNLVGSSLLCGVAIVGRQWGFILLNGVWALVSLGGLIALVRRR